MCAPSMDFRVPLLALASGLGCNAEPCSPTSLDHNTPSPAIECAAGQLCYQGTCIDACNAGRERSDVCGADRDCPSARPMCNQGFCSACAPGETCVPTLNLCRFVIRQPTPDPPPVPPVSNPKFPLDAGAIDGSAIDPGLVLDTDAGQPTPPAGQEVTHVLFVDVAQLENHLGAAPWARSSVAVRAFNVSGNGVDLRWRGDFDPPLIECRDNDANHDGCGARRSQASGECVIRPLRTVTGPTAPTAVNLGDVRIEDTIDRPSSIRTPVELAYRATPAGYQVEPPTPLPDDLLVFSALPRDQHFVLVTGKGSPGIVDPWPVGPNAGRGHHVPFRLRPSPETLQDHLARIPVITQARTENLIFRWTRIDSGTDTFERVHIRITGNEHELSCLTPEGQNGADTIQVAAGLLNGFLGLEGPGDYPLDFERSNTLRLLVHSAAGKLAEATVRVRHTFQSEITFQ